MKRYKNMKGGAVRETQISVVDIEHSAVFCKRLSQRCPVSGGTTRIQRRSGVAFAWRGMSPARHDVLNPRLIANLVEVPPLIELFFQLVAIPSVAALVRDLRVGVCRPRRVYAGLADVMPTDCEAEIIRGGRLRLN